MLNLHLNVAFPAPGMLLARSAVIMEVSKSHGVEYWRHTHAVSKGTHDVIAK